MIYVSFFQSEFDEEIPIFIGNVPRYVSGINRKTTCNDIIKGNERTLPVSTNLFMAPSRL